MNIIGLLTGLLLFTLLIFSHELGHFITAKLSGVQVNEFALFMGPVIWQKKIGETMYSLRSIPLGGFCAMEGEDGESDNPRAFGAVAWWKRLIVLCAGSFMNVVLAMVLLSFVIGSAKYITEPIISQADDGCTVVGENAMQVGDRILEVDGQKVYVQSDFTLLLSLKESLHHDIVVERNGQKVYLDNLLMEKHDFLDDGIIVQRYGFRFTASEATPQLKASYVRSQAIAFVRDTGLSLRMLISGKAGINDVMGPAGIMGEIAETVEESEKAQDALLNVAYIGAFISMNLAMMNMLPIPALDGGRVFALLVITSIEKVTGKKVNPRIESYVHGAGMIVLLMFIALVTFKDILMLFKR